MRSPEMQAAVDLMWSSKDTNEATVQVGSSDDAGRPSIEQRRAAIELLGDFFVPPDDVVRSQVSARGVPGVWLTNPTSAPDRVLLYLHGGAYQIGSSHSHGELAARIARSAGTRALVIDYRLAPEHPFPAAVHDALAAYSWLLEEEGIPASSVVVAGDSAGGGLVAALLVAARDRGLALPAGAAMLSAWTDMTGSGESYRTRHDDDPILVGEWLIGAGREYLGGADARDPLASPLFADLAGLPPLLLQVGTAEILQDDSVGFARSAQTAGVDVTLEVNEELPHVFQIIANAPEAVAATERIGDFLAALLR